MLKKINDSIIENHVNLFRRKNLQPEDRIEYFISEKKDPRRVKAHINSKFFKQLRFLLGKFFFQKKSNLMYNVFAVMLN